MEADVEAGYSLNPHRPQPLDQFRRRRRNSESRMSQCRTCRNAADRLRRHDQRMRAAGQFVAEAHWTRSLDRLVSLTSAAFSQFGGPTGLSAALRGLYDHSLATGESEITLRVLNTVIRLWEARNGTLGTAG